MTENPQVGRIEFNPNDDKPYLWTGDLISSIKCARCGGHVVEFTIPNDIWNAVIRPDGRERDDEYICMACWHKALRAALDVVVNAREIVRLADSPPLAPNWATEWLKEVLEASQ